MSQQLLRRAWDALDSFKQAYPENWNEDDQQVMDDLLKADLDLSGIKRRWKEPTGNEWFEWWRASPVADATEAEIDFADFLIIVQAIAVELKEKNNG
jgi:hypothetical protein